VTLALMEILEYRRYQLAFEWTIPLGLMRVYGN
jgi:hypothetical protein